MLKRKRLPMALSFSLALFAPNAVHAQAVVTAGEDAGLDAATLRTVRSLTEIALRAHGVAVVQDATDAKRFFRIHVAKLGGQAFCQTQKARSQANQKPLKLALLRRKNHKAPQTKRVTLK